MKSDAGYDRQKHGEQRDFEKPVTDERISKYRRPQRIEENCQGPVAWRLDIVSVPASFKRLGDFGSGKHTNEVHVITVPGVIERLITDDGPAHKKQEDQGQKARPRGLDHPTDPMR